MKEVTQINGKFFLKSTELYEQKYYSITYNSKNVEFT